MFSKLDFINDERIEELINIRFEYEELDYKEIIDVNKREDIIKITKDIIAFANLRNGGYIILGVKDKDYKSIGLPMDFHIDETIIRSKVNSFCKPKINLLYREFIRKIDKKKYAVFYIFPSKEIIFTSKEGNYNFKGKTKSEFRKGDAFIRKGSSSSRIDDPKELDIIRIEKQSFGIYKVVWKKSNEFNTIDILGLRGVPESGFNPFYFNRETDRFLAKKILTKNILIIGQPLAGKSRMLYE